MPRALVRLCVAGTLLAGLAVAVGARQSELAATLQRVQELAAAEVAKDPRGSLTIGVVSRDRLVWAKSYGDEDVDRRVTATPESVYRIGPINPPSPRHETVGLRTYV